MTETTLAPTPTQPRRAEGPLELRVWGATDAQLATGLAAARDLLATHGVTAGRAVVCQAAVTAHELDPSLPAPDAGVRAAADACRQAWNAAILAAGGRLDHDDALSFAQGMEDVPLWDALPTLKAWRARSAPTDGDAADIPPVQPTQPGSTFIMTLRSLLSSALIGAVASARSMTPMAALATARLAGRRTPGELLLLDRPLVKYGALAMGVGELLGDKMKSAPDRTVPLGLIARIMSAGIAGAALAPKGREQAGAAVAVAAAVPLAYATLAGRKRAMASIGQTRSGLVEDALVVAAGAAVVAWALRSRNG